MEQRIKKFLAERKEKGLLRTLTPISRFSGSKIYIDSKEYVNFSSNDYLGIADDPELISAVLRILPDRVGISGSRLMTGTSGVHIKLENRIAEFKNKEAALVFNSGYQANVGIISSLCRKGDCIFTDRLNHASITDGILLSGVKYFRFKHNDTGHLEELLKKERSKYKSALIVTETVFSMDGDIAPIEKIVHLKDIYKCMFMVDEAHATGVFGQNGAGIVSAQNLSGKVDIIMGTFSKALGGFGAYAAMSRELRDYMINVCRSFIYSTALPPVIVMANLKALDLVVKETKRRQVLLENSTFLREKLLENGFKTKGETQIVPVIMGENKKALLLSDRLKESGFWVIAVRPPTVPAGEARLRLSLTFNHTKDMLENFIKELCGHKKTLGY
ncbi:MAG: 8-amino-7-oxononanoate synthase [Candidatus Omnitrophota bacterium]|nr:8-amino-7-oxononanoate synthase [Candidatus Omnitrophota bacterium]MBU1894721.1 8-amino-7-oxononanoate synthase [Candidatus Omnitrophota bacterium]